MNEGAFLKVIRDYECSKNSPLIWGNLDTPVDGLDRPISPRYLGEQETYFDMKIFLPELLPMEEYDWLSFSFQAEKIMNRQCLWKESDKIAV